jgi:uncharacterized protein YqhQ
MTEKAAVRPYIGGQAVMEGVMMRAPSSLAIVLRRRDGRLQVRERPMQDARTGIKALPLVRGLLAFGESLKLGQECLKYSLAALEEDMTEEEAAAAAPKGPGASASMMNYVSAFARAFNTTLFATITRADGEAAPSGKSSGLSLVMLLPMIAFMVALPQIAAMLATKFLHINAPMQSPQFQAITGAFKLTIVLGYMLILRRTEYVKRMFQYHGAEHKTITTYEAGEELTVANARGKTTLHARCGTTFLVMVVLMSVLMFSVLGAVLPKIDTGRTVVDGMIFFLVKLPFLPVIAAITFELQRIFAKYFTEGPLRVVLLPGFLVQKITTIEPSDDQLEVALASLRVTLFRLEATSADKATGDDAAQAALPADVFFPDYESLHTADKLRA